MYFRYLSVCCLALILSATIAHAAPLRVCADPDNMLFSNSRAQGFDNKIAEQVGRTMARPIDFVWSRVGRGFVRDLLNTGACDVLFGVPSQFRAVLTTRPYYTSSFAFVYKDS